MVRARQHVLGYTPWTHFSRGLVTKGLLATRGAVIRAWELERVLPKDRVYASGIAGGVSGGGVAALTSMFEIPKPVIPSSNPCSHTLVGGRANVIPGAIMFLIFGALGQKTYNFLDAKHTQNAEVAMNDSEIRKTFLQKVADMKWSPMKVLSDEDYEKMLKERLLRVNAEIAILDEDMASLKAVVDTDCPWKDISGKN